MSGAALRVDVRVARSGHGFVLEAAFEAPPGVTILFGPSGAGKSTLLAAIAGLVRPERGRVALGDDVWFDAEARVDRPVQARRVAFVFQSLALFPHLTAEANVAYGMDRRLPRAERGKRARAMLARVRVEALAERRPATYSGGEAQRVALARAFVIAPAIVLLDEPFSALDAELRADLAADVRALVGELGVPMLHVTHDRAEARSLGDRVVLLEGGRVRAVGSVEEVLPARGSG
jgi:molybdate transport system ATP-binding protein